MTPKLLIHGGAGLIESRDITEKRYDKELKPIVKATYQVLLEYGARAAVLEGVRMMEDCSVFNAGYGSKLQKDGEVRMSAAIMDSKSNKFSGVINIRNVRHPIDVADQLSKGRHTVLSGEQATEYARRKKIQYFNPIAPHRLKEYADKLSGDTGTVGVVALDSNGLICAGTSTGGIGYEIPGRVSDSATVAGTYASKHCAVSCTGRGEYITSFALAAKVVTRVEDGVELNKAIQRAMQSAKKARYRMGLIAVDYYGNIVVGNGHDTKVLFATYDGKKTETFYNLKNIALVV